MIEGGEPLAVGADAFQSLGAVEVVGESTSTADN